MTHEEFVDELVLVTDVLVKSIEVEMTLCCQRLTELVHQAHESGVDNGLIAEAIGHSITAQEIVLRGALTGTSTFRNAGIC